MSKHFELMQQIEKERAEGAAAEAVPAVHPEPAAPAVNGNDGNDGNHFQVPAGQRADEDTLRLVQQVFLVQCKEPPRVVVFASVDHGNGCSRISAAVAETLGRNNHGRVCLVEANFRSPALPAMFGVPNHFGLTEALLREGPVSSFAKRVTADNLWLLSSGTLATDSPSLLAGDQLRGRMGELRKQFDFVIIDAPPLNRYSDGVVLGRHCDGLVLILEANSTRREAAQAVTENLCSANVPILAAVLNKRTYPIPEKIYSLL